MRVTQRRLRGDDGVSAVISVVALFGIMSALLLSVDAGSLWSARRAVVTATDATALEQARLAAIFGEDAACAGWESRLQANAGAETEALTCDVTQGPTANTGYVTIDARKPAAVRFGGLYGKGDDWAFSSSTARWGYITQLEGVRPIALCIQDAHVAGYLGLGADAGEHPSNDVHRVYFTKDNPTTCGSRAPGNWGFVDFDGGANSNTDLRTWLLSGWDGTVGVGDCDATTTAPTGCSGDTGASGASIASALNALVESDEAFPLILFDAATGVGATTRYAVWGFLGVYLRGFRVTGPESGRYFDLEFTRITRQGNCCSPTGRDTGVLGLGLCQVDHTQIPTAARCLG